jgi:hypothetical protein
MAIPSRRRILNTGESAAKSADPKSKTEANTREHKLLGIFVMTYLLDPSCQTTI